MRSCVKEPVEVLYCDNHLLALNKPAGMLTQPNQTHDLSLEEWGKDWLKNRFQKPGNVFLAAVHRLDRPVSGIVLFARTSKALQRVNTSMREGLFQKQYLALVEGRLTHPEGTLEHYMRHDNLRAQIVSAQDPRAKKCVLSYRSLNHCQDCTLLEIELLTGRYHQIRAQFSAFGHPIVGDSKYGSRNFREPLFLHHARLNFPHPVMQKQLILEAPVPEIWRFKKLSQGACSMLF